MRKNKQKLELTWIGKENRPELEPHILLEYPKKSYHVVKWCGHATDHAQSNGGKPWQYLIVPHDVVADNMTLAGLAGREF
ncbi:MAG: hypothetical protein QM483_11800 [Desulfuromusa sp.]